MTHPTLRWFDAKHLPLHSRKLVQPFTLLAENLDDWLPEGAEKSATFRHLLEAKDCAVRAGIEAYEKEERPK